MSQQTSSDGPASFQKEKTFTAYNKEQGAAYAQARPDYHPNVYNIVVEHHKSTGGQCDTLVDLGCGPGMVARGLAPSFDHAIGLDTSAGMIETASSLGGSTTSSEPIRFGVSSAEEIGQNLSPPVADGSVDLITAANAAHWFDMAGFWPAAARVLKPGGSVALWTTGPARIHPDVPNAAAIQTLVDQHADNLKPYLVPGNLIVRGNYVDLQLPWTLPQPVPEFEESALFRKVFEVDEKFLVRETMYDMDGMEKVMKTGSPTTRWYQEHPGTEGTDRDILKILRKDVERLLHEAGVDKGKEKIKGAVRGTLLIFKKNI